jgi:hypothetical protein
MTQKNRVKRSRADLQQELDDQLRLLTHACESFDSGLQPISKHIALSLRVLLHHYGQSRSLLEQLKLRDKRFLDTAGDLNPGNSLPENRLCAMKMGAGEDQYLPWCLVGSSLFGERWVPFVKWWNNPVVKDDQGRFFNRRELVLNVADTDGGAHVDPDLDEAYMDLSRNNSLGWVITDGNVEKPFPPPTMACIRQIAHEVLVSIKKSTS